MNRHRNVVMQVFSALMILCGLSLCASARSDVAAAAISNQNFVPGSISYVGPWEFQFVLFPDTISYHVEASSPETGTEYEEISQVRTLSEPGGAPQTSEVVIYDSSELTPVSADRSVSANMFLPIASGVAAESTVSWYYHLKVQTLVGGVIVAEDDWDSPVSAYQLDGVYWIKQE